MSFWSRFKPKPAPLPSPCRKTCMVNDDGICLGCGRLPDEIADWQGAPRERQLQILDLSAKRLKQLRASA